MRTEHMDTPFGGVDISFSLTGAAGLGITGLTRFDSADIDEMVDQLLVNWPKIRNDANSSIAFARGLEYIYATVEEVEFPELRAPDFIPLSTEVPAGSLTFTYRMLEKTGAAQVIHNFAGDLPLVGFKGKEWQAPVITIGCAYAFSLMDVERAAKLNVPLEAMLAAACKWAIEFLSEQVAANGMVNEGVVGLTNAPGVVATTQVSAGTWLHQIALIGAATPAAPWAQIAAVQGIVADVNAMKSKVRVGTQGIYAIDTVLSSLAIYSAFEAVPASPFTTDTLIDYLEKLCHVTFDFWVQLDAASTTGHGRVMGYKKDPRVLRLVQPRLFTQAPPQARNLGWLVPCFAELGGTQVLRPLAVTWMDGLDDTA